LVHGWVRVESAQPEAAPAPVGVDVEDGREGADLEAGRRQLPLARVAREDPGADEKPRHSDEVGATGEGPALRERLGALLPPLADAFVRGVAGRVQAVDS